MNMQLTQVLFGALVLSLVHVPMPNHWVPVVMVSKIENWTRGETLGKFKSPCVAIDWV